jgi:hypothetical protein
MTIVADQLEDLQRRIRVLERAIVHWHRPRRWPIGSAPARRRSRHWSH